jgi:LSD1 subclass zinc finger protein
MTPQALVEEARSLGLFVPHGAFEVHCSNCHTRLDPLGDCPNCGLIGRPAEEIERRAMADPAATEKLLRRAIDKRRAYRPVKG